MLPVGQAKPCIGLPTVVLDAAMTARRTATLAAAPNPCCRRLAAAFAASVAAIMQAVANARATAASHTRRAECVLSLLISTGELTTDDLRWLPPQEPRPGAG